MPPNTSDEELLADFLLKWEESDRHEPMGEAAERLASRYPHLIDELKRRMVYLNQMSWLDDPTSNSIQHGDEDKTPQKLTGGRYRLLKMLSSSWGRYLYHARDEELGRDVAIKVPRTTDRLAADGLLQEGRCVSRLRHPGIVPVYDVGRDEERVFVVYGFIKGINLSQRIAQGPIYWREALEITRQLTLAVSHAHENGVLHRDIKPSNILVDHAGVVLLADFGSASPMTQLPQHDSLGSGAVAYTAPEVLLGQESSPATDYYSIGMVLYALLQGRPLGAGVTVSELSDLILSPREWDSGLFKEVPRQVVSLCRAMIAKDPNGRLTDPGIILKLIDNAAKPRRFSTQIWIWALGTMVPIMLAGWWLIKKNHKPVITEAFPGFQHEPSPDGTIGLGSLKLPVGLAFAPDGTMLVANTAKGNICRFRRDGGLVQVFGKRGSGNQFLFYPHGVACGADGKVYVSDHGNHVVHCYSPDGELLRSVGGYGTAPSRFMEPHGLAFDSEGLLYVGDHGNKRVQVFDQQLQLKSVIHLADKGVLKIVGVLVDGSGRLLVSDTKDGCVRVFSKQGDDLGKMSAGPEFKPLWLALDPRGQVWVGDADKHVVVFDSHLKQVRLKGLDKRLSFYPQGIAFGPKGELAVVNYSEGRVVFIRDIPEAEPESGAGEKSSPAEKGR